jgi:hypothetical protein
MAGELRFNEVATPTTPSAGKDAVYVSNETLPRLRRLDSAGNVWPLADIFAMSLAADYTLTDSSTAQKAFNATTNGAITLPANSGYLLEAEYLITNTGTTSHTWAVLFAGTATITALDFAARGRSGATSQFTLAADSSASQSNGSGSLPTTALVMTAASTSATENVLLSIRGTLRINAAGTFIPQVKLSAGTGGTEKMLRGSFIRLTPIGTDTATNLGNWS